MVSNDDFTQAGACVAFKIINQLKEYSSVYQPNN